MSPHPDLPIRIGRLFNGAVQRRIRNDDLYALFLALRELSYCTAQIKEIGNFIAHRNRQRGYFKTVTRKLDALLGMLRYQIEHRELDNQIIFSHLPPEFKQVVADAWMYMPRRLIADHAGFDINSLNSIYLSAIAKLEASDYGTKVNDPLLLEEKVVLQTLAQSISGASGFTGRQLLAEVTNSLIENGLIPSGYEKVVPRVLGIPISLFAMTAMHLCVLDGKSGQIILKIGCNSKHLLHVNAVQDYDYKGNIRSVALNIFQTDLSADDFCGPDLLQIVKPGTGTFWNWPIELSGDYKLVYLRGPT